MSRIETIFDEDAFERHLEKLEQETNDDESEARQQAREDFPGKFLPPRPSGSVANLAYTAEWQRLRFRK